MAGMFGLWIPAFAGMTGFFFDIVLMLQGWPRHLLVTPGLLSVIIPKHIAATLNQCRNIGIVPMAGMFGLWIPAFAGMTGFFFDIVLMLQGWPRHLLVTPGLLSVIIPKHIAATLNQCRNIGAEG